MLGKFIGILYLYGMINFILKKLGYLHIDEICRTIEEYADDISKEAPYNPYKPKTQPWYQQLYANYDAADKIRWLKRTFKTKVDR